MIAVLAGGTGSAKLVRGLAAITDDLVVISNVGDNLWLYGLYICPDIDTVVYALADLLDEKRGWGVRGDSFNFLDQARRLGLASWFSLGDRDLATHVLRTQMLRDGDRLSKVTDAMSRRLGVKAKIIPATDDQVTTCILTDRGKMHLQEFWVKHKGLPRVNGVSFDGSKTAIPNEKAINAIRRAGKIIIAPGNPVSSIGPTLAIKDFRRALTEKRNSVIAVSPIIGKSAVSGPAVKYMKAQGLANSPVGVAKYYGSSVGNFVIAKSDHGVASKIQDIGMKVFETDIMMKDKQAEIRLARYLVSGLSER